MLTLSTSGRWRGAASFGLLVASTILAIEDASAALTRTPSNCATSLTSLPMSCPGAMPRCSVDSWPSSTLGGETERRPHGWPAGDLRPASASRVANRVAKTPDNGGQRRTNPAKPASRSTGRRSLAGAWQCGGQGFESPQLHFGRYVNNVRILCCP